MEFNSIVFAAPVCSYSSETYYRELIYVPTDRESSFEKEAKRSRMVARDGLNLSTIQEENENISLANDNYVFGCGAGRKTQTHGG